MVDDAVVPLPFQAVHHDEPLFADNGAVGDVLAVGAEDGFPDSDAVIGLPLLAIDDHDPLVAPPPGIEISPSVRAEAKGALEDLVEGLPLDAVDGHPPLAVALRLPGDVAGVRAGRQGLQVGARGQLAERRFPRDEYRVASGVCGQGPGGQRRQKPGPRGTAEMAHGLSPFLAPSSAARRPHSAHPLHGRRQSVGAPRLRLERRHGRLGMPGKKGALPDQFRAVGVVRKHVPFGQAVELDSSSICGNADEFVPHKVAARVHVVHPQLHDALRVALAAGRTRPASVRRVRSPAPSASRSCGSWLLLPEP